MSRKLGLVAKPRRSDVPEAQIIAVVEERITY